MAQDLLIVSIVVGMLLVAILVGWVRPRLAGVTRAVLAEDGVQEVEVVVRGCYRPDTIIVRRDLPLRIVFHRQEATPCSEKVIFSEFQQERRLAPFATTVVRFIPTRSGEFLFTCGLGMYQGRLLVEEPRGALPEPSPRRG